MGPLNTYEQEWELSETALGKTSTMLTSYSLSSFPRCGEPPLRSIDSSGVVWLQSLRLKGIKWIIGPGEACTGRCVVSCWAFHRRNIVVSLPLAGGGPGDVVCQPAGVLKVDLHCRFCRCCCCCCCCCYCCCRSLPGRALGRSDRSCLR